MERLFFIDGENSHKINLTTQQVQDLLTEKVAIGYKWMYYYVFQRRIEVPRKHAVYAFGALYRCVHQNGKAVTDWEYVSMLVIKRK